MFDPAKLLDQFLGSPGPTGKRPGPSGDMMKGFAAGNVTGSIAAILLGGGSSKKMLKTALKTGGTAAIAGLAYKAWSEWQNSRAGDAAQLPPPAADAEGTAFLPAPKPQRDAASLAILTAMIAAAKADGHIDAAEQQRIFAKLDEHNLDSEAKAFLMDELRKPLDIDAVVRLGTTPELAVEIYAASCMAIDPDDAAEQAYLAMLAARLKLMPELKLGIEKEVATLKS